MMIWLRQSRRWKKNSRAWPRRTLRWSAQSHISVICSFSTFMSDRLISKRMLWYLEHFPLCVACLQKEKISSHPPLKKPKSLNDLDQAHDDQEIAFLKLQVLEQQSIIDDLTRVRFFFSFFLFKKNCIFFLCFYSLICRVGGNLGCWMLLCIPDIVQSTCCWLRGPSGVWIIVVHELNVPVTKYSVQLTFANIWTNDLNDEIAHKKHKTTDIINRELEMLS